MSYYWEVGSWEVRGTAKFDIFFFLFKSQQGKIDRNFVALNLATLQIIAANDLPIRLHQHATLRYQDSFLALGGNTFLDVNCNVPCGCTNGKATDAIWK